MTKTILLADDSVTIQKVVELTFSEGDYRVTCVSNGKSAVQKLQESRPDILLCDVIMPEMNGYEVAAFVKKNPTYSAIPVILLTGTFEPFDEEKARQSGADTFITKPFDSKMLIEKVEELLSRRAVLDTSQGAGPAQVFHSRQEFTIPGSEGSEQASDAEEAEAPAEQEPSPFLAGEQEYPMPEEEPAESESLETRALDRADLEGVMEEPAPPVDEEKPAPQENQEEPAAEEVDLGPFSPEDSLQEEALDNVVAAPTSLHDDDVELPALEQDVNAANMTAETPPPPGSSVDEEVFVPEEEVAEWPREETVPVEESPEERADREAESVSGAEDWGAGQTVGGFEEEEPPATEVLEPTSLEAPFSPPAERQEGGPEVIHAMTEQQEMVTEAQAELDKQSEAQAAAPPEWNEPIEESPFLPEEGVETVLPEVASEPPAQQPEGEATEEAEVIEEEEVTAEGAQPEEVQPITPEAEPVAEEEAAIEVGAPPVAEAIGRVEIERMVRALVSEMMPGLVREVAAEMAPSHIREAAAETAPNAIRQAVEAAAPEQIRGIVRELAPAVLSNVAGEVMPDMVKKAVSESAPQAIQAAMAESAPELVRQTAVEVVEKTVPDYVKSEGPELVAKMVREIAPDLIRQVAWEVIPELAESVIKRRIQELESEVG